MRALCWNGTNDVRLENVPDPAILNPQDAIVRVTLTAICGSDLHLYDGYIPTMEKGDILGHEFMGEVVEVGPGVKNLRPGERVVVPFTIACGHCAFCSQGLSSLCDNSNPNGWMTEKLHGYPAGGLFGYSHMMGGYAGGQAEYVRVPFADVGPFRVPPEISDEQALFLSDIFPTGYMAAENCTIHPGDTVAIWGCGPVGQFAIQSAFLLGAERVIAIDRYADRLRLAASWGRAEVLDYEHVDILDALREMTGGRGPDSCIDAVGMEAHGTSIDALSDRTKQALRVGTDRPHVLRMALQACRKGGTVSIPGVYGGVLDNVPLGAAFGKGLTLKMGQTHVHRYLRPLMEMVQAGRIEPSLLITHRLSLEEGPAAYETFKHKRDGCIKVVMRPEGYAPKRSNCPSRREPLRGGMKKRRATDSRWSRRRTSVEPLIYRWRPGTAPSGEREAVRLGSSAVKRCCASWR
jgi:threonine dehydrogenase-like Zn-dependent dehydrogenase